MKTMDKENFDNLLLENKGAALEKLKDEHGKYLDEVEIGTLKYKIFETVPEELFTERNSPKLPECSYHAFILCDVDFLYESKGEIERRNFSHWYFIGGVKSRDCKFIGITDFSCSNFTNDVDFSYSNFTNADFSCSKFTNDAHFTGCTFSIFVTFHEVIFYKRVYFIYAKINEAFFCRTDFFGFVHFTGALFNGKVDFGKAKFYKELFLDDAVFKERCDLRVEHFGNLILIPYQLRINNPIPSSY